MLDSCSLFRCMIVVMCLIVVRLLMFWYVKGFGVGLFFSCV